MNTYCPEAERSGRDRQQVHRLCTYALAGSWEYTECFVRKSTGLSIFARVLVLRLPDVTRTKTKDKLRMRKHPALLLDNGA